MHPLPECGLGFMVILPISNAPPGSSLVGTRSVELNRNQEKTSTPPSG